MEFDSEIINNVLFHLHLWEFALAYYFYFMMLLPVQSNFEIIDFNYIEVLFVVAVTFKGDQL